MVVVWSNGAACTHCGTFANAVSNSVFTEFQQSYKIVWCYVNSSDSNTAAAYDFCYNGQILYPLIRYYWKKGGKTLLSKYTMGDTLDGQKDGKKGANNVISGIKKAFKSAFQKNGYDPNA